MSVQEAQEKISASEFTEWMAYYKIQPFGDRHADEHNAWQCYWSYVAMNGNKDVKPQDFLIGSEDTNKATSVEDKMLLLQTISKEVK